MANLMPQIAKMLGVELGEEFEVKGYKGLTYKFIIDELIVCNDNNTETAYISANMTLISLIRGEKEIVKLPWKPKAGDEYYSFGYARKGWFVRKGQWTNHPVDFAFLDKGWVYRTRAEAEAALPKVAAEIGAEYEL